MSKVSLQSLERLSVDLGNGGFKGAAIRGDETRQVVTAFLPAKVGVGDTDLGALSLAGLERKRRAERPVSIVSDDGAYLVGANVERYAQVLERFDAGKYTNSPELRAVMRALLAKMVDGGLHDVALVVELPVNLLMSSNARETVRGVEAWLLGPHYFECDGIETRVNVCAIKIIAQPVGAFCAWGLDLAGNWARDEQTLTESTVAVLDLGFNSLDLLTVKRGQIEKRFTGGDDLGVRVAAEEIANALSTRYGVRWTVNEVDELIREYLERRRVVRVFAGERVDLTRVVAQALNTLATRAVDYVQRTWRGATDFSHVLMVGGGALVLDSQIRKHIPHAEIPTDPVTGASIDPVFANAIGGAKIAMRAGTFRI